MPFSLLSFHEQLGTKLNEKWSISPGLVDQILSKEDQDTAIALTTMILKEARVPIQRNGEPLKSAVLWMKIAMCEVYDRLAMLEANKAGATVDKEVVNIESSDVVASAAPATKKKTKKPKEG